MDMQAQGWREGARWQLNAWRGWAGRWGLVLLFLALAAPAGLSLALLTPLGDVADEPAHLGRAAGLLHGDWLGERGPPPLPGVAGAGVEADAGLLAISGMEQVSARGTPLPPAVRAAARAQPWAGVSRFFPTQMVQYFPAFYLPAALGLGAGRLAGLGPLGAAYVARLAMLAAYLGMGAAALRLAAFGRPLLFVLLLLPGSLAIAASLSQDGQLLAAAALAAALLTRARGEPGPGWGAALLLLLLVCGAKPPYAPLLGFCLLPWRAPGLRRRAMAMAGALLLLLLWLQLMSACCYTDWTTAPYQPGPLWPGPALWLPGPSPAKNFAVLRAHPAQALLLPARVLVERSFWVWRDMIGGLSWNYVFLPEPLIGAWGAALALAACAAWPRAAAPWRRAEAATAGLLLAGTYLAVALSIYLSWTPVGADRLLGVNGRYLLLLLPFLAFLRPAGRGGVVAAWAWLCPTLALAVFDLVYLPAFTFHIFRMPGP